MLCFNGREISSLKDPLQEEVGSGVSHRRSPFLLKKLRLKFYIFDKRLMRNVIICIDGSSCANYAFRWAAENFLRSDDHVVLLHATKDFKNLEPPMNEPGKKGVFLFSFTPSITVFFSMR